MDQLRHEVERRPGALHVRLLGVLDLASRPAFSELADGLLDDADGPVVLDLSDLDFLDSTGIVELIRAARRAEEEGIDLSFVAPRDGAARRTADVVGLARILGWEERPAP